MNPLTSILGTIISGFILAALTLSLTLWGCGSKKKDQATKEQPQSGAASGTVSITHPEIPALQWPAMTMDFNLASPEVVKGVAPGSAIRFEFEAGEPGEYAVTRMEAAAANGHKGH